MTTEPDQPGMPAGFRIEGVLVDSRWLNARRRRSPSSVLKGRSRAQALLLCLALVGFAATAFGQQAMDPPESSPALAEPAEMEISPELALSLQVEDIAESEEALAVPTVPEWAPAGGYRSEIERAWFGAGDNLRLRAAHARQRALEIGVKNVESASRAIMSAGAGPAESAEMIDAVRLSSDLPAVHMALAGAYWREGERSLAVQEIVAGLHAIPWHLEATLWLVSSVLVMFAAVLVVGSLIFITVVACSVFSHAAHDIGDLVSGSTPSFARAALLGALILLPLALGEGLIGLVLALFAVGFIYGGSRHRMALNLAAVLIILGLYPVSLFSSRALGALNSDPVAAAALAVVRGIESPADLELLERKRESDLLARRTLAVRERHRGELDRSQAEYEYLLERDPSDAALIANLGSLLFRGGDTERAIELYERAALLIDSPTLYFNLAQAYARVFRMDAYESAMARAQTLDPDVVADLSRSGDTAFVADLAHPLAPVRRRLINSASESGGELSHAAVALVAPGRLGAGWQVLAAGFALAAIGSLLVSGRFDHASSCNRCGRRICGRCDGTVWSSQTCEACHRLFNRPETTDSSLRMARLKTLRAREQRLDRIATIAAVAVPGAAGLLAKRPDLSFMGILLFVGAVVALVWRDGVVADPFVVGAAGPLAFSIVGMLCLVAYLGVVMSGLIVRRSL